MAGYKSVSFDPSAMQTEINTASSVAVVAAAKASDASSVAAARSAAWDGAAAAASDAGSKATAAAAAASNALSKASGASDAILVLASSVIRSIPGIGSYAVKEFVVTSASQIKARYSSVARAA